ncbi:MAG: oligopeptidase B, partial [Cyclobacteriaceae bacterium]
MKYSLLLAVFILASCTSSETKVEEIAPPDAEKDPYELTNLGETRVDDYYWMRLSEDQRNASEPDAQTTKVINYLTEENMYREEIMGEQLALEDELYEEMVSRVKQDDSSVPYSKNGYTYYTRFEEGFDYPVYLRKKDGDDEASEEILINANEMGKDYSFFQVRSLSVSPDNKWLAYAIDTVGRRKFVGMFKNLETGEVLDERLPLFASGDWAADSKTFLYTRIDNETLRPYELFVHKLGEPAAEDMLKFTEPDDTYGLWLQKSKSGEYFFLNAGKSGSNDVKFLSTATPELEFTTFYPRTQGVEYQIDHFGDDFYILTNEEAVNFRLMKTPVDAVSPEHWTTVIQHRDDVLIEGIELFTTHLVLSERMDGLKKLRVMNMKDGSEHYVDFEEEAYVVYIGNNPEFETDVLRVQYTSMTTPWTVYDYNMNTREREMRKQDEVLGGFDPDDYETQRIWATARDGVQVPISIVYKKGLERNGENPLLLYGYGSYGLSTEPWFDAKRLSLLDRGWVWANAHIRGGSEMGRQWYDDGKMFKK